MSLLDGISLFPGAGNAAGGQLGGDPALGAIYNFGTGTLGFAPAAQKKEPDLLDFLASSVLGLPPDVIGGLTGKNTGVNGYPLANDLNNQGETDQSKLLLLVGILSALFEDEQANPGNGQVAAPRQAAPLQAAPRQVAPAPAPPPPPQILDIGNLKIDQAGIDSIRNAPSANEKINAAKAALLKASGGGNSRDVLNLAFGTDIKKGKNKDKASDAELQQLAVTLAQSIT
jgi:hypothetical protein